MSYGRGGSRFGGFATKPVETYREYDVQITEISRKGDGIAKVQGVPIFEKNGQVGQNTKVSVTRIGSTFAIAEIVQ